jgi:hypothetical protein
VGQAPVVVVKHVQGQADLAKIVAARHPRCTSADHLNGWEEEGQEKSDDSQDDDELDDGESKSAHDGIFLSSGDQARGGYDRRRL